MTTPDKVQIGSSQDYLDGVAVDTSAGTGLFRETVVLADPTNGGGLANVRQLSTQLVSADMGVVTNTVIHGLTTAGGGSYVGVKVNPSGALAVDAGGSQLPLPSGAATSAKQLPDNHQVSVSNFPATQPVSVSSLPLPSGAATQTTLAAVLAALQATLTAQIAGEVEVKNDSGNPIPVSGTVSSLDSSEREYTPVVRNVTASGDTTVYTPAVGKRVRLHKLIIANDPNAGSSPLITVKMGTTSYHMLFNAAIRQVDTGPVEAGGGEGALKVNLSQAGNVACTFRLEEV